MKIKDAKWKMTDDAIGMKPRFRVWCKECFWAYVERRIVEMCDLNEYTDYADFGEDNGYSEAFDEALTQMLDGKFDMFLRECFCSPLPTIGEKAFHNDMHYKCCGENGCDVVKVFGVPIDKEYHEELLRRREGQGRIQPWLEWMKIAELKKQLRGLGYL